MNGQKNSGWEQFFGVFFKFYHALCLDNKGLAFNSQNNNFTSQILGQAERTIWIWIWNVV